MAQFVYQWLNSTFFIVYVENLLMLELLYLVSNKENNGACMNRICLKYYIIWWTITFIAFLNSQKYSSTFHNKASG